MMKIILMTFFLVAGCFASSAVQEQDVFFEGPRCPPRDPLVEEQVDISITYDPIVRLRNGSKLKDLVINNLTALHYIMDRFPIDPYRFNVYFEATIEKIVSHAKFTVTVGYVDAHPFRPETIHSGNLSAVDANGELSASNVHLRAALSFLIQNNRLTVQQLNVLVSFEDVFIDLGNLKVNGGTIDWAELSENLKANFDKDFADNTAEITDKIRKAVNRYLGQWTWEQIKYYFQLIVVEPCNTTSYATAY